MGWLVQGRMIDFKLYLITDRRLCAAGFLEAVVAQACGAGVRAVQLREKDLPARELYTLALTMRKVTGRTGSRLFINDRADVAQGVGADGVHCPENGLPVRAARRVSPEAIVGASAHSLERAREAGASGADFVLFGPVFPTPSKAKYGPPQGMDALEIVAGQAGVPVFAVGGITPESARLCLKHGAAGVAVVSAIMAAKDVGEVVEGFRSSLGGL
jgi:thiamine-phosphate pyrophosphorylase